MISPDKMTENAIIPCERCGKNFKRHAGDIHSCQSSTTPVDSITREFLMKTSWECLCSFCLEEINALLTSLEGIPFPKPTELKKDFHYYIENGFCVFTERYHILRGSCCKNGCRHCAYGFKKQT